MEERMKLHKIISGFFLILFLIGFAPSVFASSDTTPPGCGSIYKDIETCKRECQNNSSSYCNLLLKREQANSGKAGDNEGDSNRQPADAPRVQGVNDQLKETAADAATGKVKDKAKDWIKKKLFGDPAVSQAYNQKLMSQFNTEQTKCNAVTSHFTPIHHLFCMKNSMECKDAKLDQACSIKGPTVNFEKLESEAQNKMVGLAQTLAGKLSVSASEIMGDIKNQVANQTTCGNAWRLAQLTCQFPVQALGGKVTKALNVIGKVAMGTQMVAGLAGKSLNDLCKALTTLSGAGVTIAILARTKCAFAMNRCQQYCEVEKKFDPGYCTQLRKKKKVECERQHNICRAACAGVGFANAPCSSCVYTHINMAQYACKVEHINKMKRECSLLQRKTMAMMGDIVQLIATVKSAKMCWDKSGGDMSPSIDPETCRKMGGTPYIDETTGDQRCRFREPVDGEGKCPPFGVPVFCDQPCEDGSVPEGCPQGVCENGEVVSCTKTCPPNGSVPEGCDTCPDPSLTYPYCDCNCQTGQTCNENRQCVNPGGDCTTDDDCGGGQVCNPEGQCVNPGGDCTTDDDCQENEVCKDNVCVNASCNSDDDCSDGQVCQDGTCGADNCKCQDAVWPCDRQCGGKCVEESVNCPCQGDGECTPPQKCITNTDGQNVCSDDDGEGICPDGSRIPCDQNCSDDSEPANCRTCNGDSDCGENQTCSSSGVCIPKSSESCKCEGEDWPCDKQCDNQCTAESVNCPCTSDGECTSPQKCVSGADGQNVCVNVSCSLDTDCGNGQVCQDETCVDANQSCTTNDDCGNGQVCQDETCVDANQSCTTNDDCGNGQVCQDETCVDANQSCTTNDDCQANESCVDDQCKSLSCTDPSFVFPTCNCKCPDGYSCNADKICIKSCKCHGGSWPCNQKCDNQCPVGSINCPCTSDGGCTKQKCVTNSDGQKVCSDDDGLGICLDGSRVDCDQNCPDGSNPANCRTCGGDSDCGENQICNRGTCVTEDPVLTADGLGGGGAPTDGGLDAENGMAITNDGMGGGGANDPNDPNDSNNLGNTANLPGASSGKQRKGLLARLGALLGVKGGGSLGSRGLSGRRGSKRTDLIKDDDDDETGKVKGAGRGGYGGYGSGGGGALNPAAGGLGFGATAAQIKKQKGNKRTAFPTHLGNIGGVHQDIFKAVTKRYQKLYKLKNTLNR